MVPPGWDRVPTEGWDCAPELKLALLPTIGEPAGAKEEDGAVVETKTCQWRKTRNSLKRNCLRSNKSFCSLSLRLLPHRLKNCSLVKAATPDIVVNCEVTRAETEKVEKSLLSAGE